MTIVQIWLQLTIPTVTLRDLDETEMPGQAYNSRNIAEPTAQPRPTMFLDAD